jgi:hypothetical protein
MSWPGSWAGSSASAPGLGTTSFSLRGRRRALLQPAVPAGCDLWSSVPAYGRRPVLIRSRLQLAVRGPPVAPSARCSKASLVDPVLLDTLRLGVRLLLRACLLMRCPGRQRPLASRPAARTGSEAGHLTWGTLRGLRPAWPIRMTSEEGRWPACGPSPSVRPGRATVHLYKERKKGRTWPIRAGEKRRSFGGGARTLRTRRGVAWPERSGVFGRCCPTRSRWATRSRGSGKQITTGRHVEWVPITKGAGHPVSVPNSTVAWGRRQSWSNIRSKLAMMVNMSVTIDPRDEIRKEAERVHEAALFASETQFEYAKRWRRVDRWISSLSALLAATAGVGGLSHVLSARGAGLIAILAAGASAIAASIGAPQTKEKAQVSANAYRALQQDARIFLKIDLTNLPNDAARNQLQHMVDRLQKLNRESETPSGGAWRRAKKKVSRGSQDYQADHS